MKGVPVIIIDVSTERIKKKKRDVHIIGLIIMTLKGVPVIIKIMIINPITCTSLFFFFILSVDTSLGSQMTS